MINYPSFINEEIGKQQGEGWGKSYKTGAAPPSPPSL